MKTISTQPVNLILKRFMNMFPWPFMLHSFSAVPLRQLNDLESVQVADLLARGYTPPQSRNQVVDDDDVPSITTDDDGSRATNTESQDNGHFRYSFETLVSSPPRIEEAVSDDVDVQTILDVLCSRENTNDRSNKPESSEKEQPARALDSEKYMSEEDIFVSRCDNDGINWLENL